LSDNTGDASFTAGEDIPFSSLNHYSYKMLHSRRIWFPAVATTAAYALIPAAAPSMTWISFFTGLAIVQRFVVRGLTNSVRKDLTGKICVVTGGTSGIGLATVQQLLDMGATVSIVSRPGKEAATLAYLQTPPESL
jgi:hypothetical protein